MNGESLTRKKTRDKSGTVVSRAAKGTTAEDKHSKVRLIRLTPHADEIIGYAASLRAQSFSSYTAEASLDRAYEDIRRHNRTMADDKKN